MDQPNAIDKVVIGGVPAAPEVSVVPVSPPESLGFGLGFGPGFSASGKRIAESVVVPPSQEGPQ
jgi:hypothetical protein